MMFKKKIWWDKDDEGKPFVVIFKEPIDRNTYLKWKKNEAS